MKINFGKLNPKKIWRFI